MLFYRWSGEAAQRLQAKPRVATATWKQILPSCLSHSGQTIKKKDSLTKLKGQEPFF